MRPVFIIPLLSLLACGNDPIEPPDSQDPDTLDTSWQDTGWEPDLDLDGFAGFEDCDDLDPEIYPGAPEQCDGLDNDCDDRIDESEDCFSCIEQLAWFVEEDDEVEDLSETLGSAWSLLETDDAEPIEWSPTEPGRLVLCDGVWSLQIETDLDLEIQGESVDDTSMDGGGAWRMLTVQDAEVHLMDLSLRNGYSDTLGGAIMQTGGQLQLQDIVIGSNTACDGGGAILIQQADLTIRDSHFSDNIAGSYGSKTCPNHLDPRRGGAIWLIDGNGSVQGSVFEENWSIAIDQPGLGGAIAIEASSLSVSDTYFESNHTSSSQWTWTEGAQGGAIHAESSEVSIDSSELKYSVVYGRGIQEEDDHTSAGRGGTLAAVDSQVTIVDTYFNDGGVAASKWNALGGTMFFQSSEVLVESSWLYQGSVGAEGGGVGGGGIASIDTQLTIRDSLIEDSGAYANNDNNPQGMGSDSKKLFFVPSGEAYGLGIFISGGALVLEDSKIMEGEGFWGSDGWDPTGGGLYIAAETESVEIINTSFVDVYVSDVYIENEGIYTLGEHANFTWP
jgi:hypothetical protein